MPSIIFTLLGIVIIWYNYICKIGNAFSNGTVVSTTNYYYDGNLLIAEVTDGDVIVYLYDINGTPIGMQYRESTYAANKVWAKNTFGAGSSTTVTIANIETPVIPDPSPITVKTGTKTTQITSKYGNSSKPISVYANKDAQHPIKSSSAGININIANFTLDLSVGLDDIGISGSITNGNTTNSFGVILNLSELKVGFEGSTAIQWDNTTETAYTNASISGWAIAALYILVTTGQYVQSPSCA